MNEEIEDFAMCPNLTDSVERNHLQKATDKPHNTRPRRTSEQLP